MFSSKIFFIFSLQINFSCEISILPFKNLACDLHMPNSIHYLTITNGLDLLAMFFKFRDLIAKKKKKSSRITLQIDDKFREQTC